MPTAFWHTHSVLDGLSRLDRPGFAVEFLRRNPRYREERAERLRQSSEHPERLAPLLDELEIHWGLLFRP